MTFLVLDFEVWYLGFVFCVNQIIPKIKSTILRSLTNNIIWYINLYILQSKNHSSNVVTFFHLKQHLKNSINSDECNECNENALLMACFKAGNFLSTFASQPSKSAECTTTSYFWNFKINVVLFLFLPKWTCFKSSGGNRSVELELLCLGFKFARPMKSHPSLLVSPSPLHHLSPAGISPI